MMKICSVIGIEVCRTSYRKLSTVLVGLFLLVGCDNFGLYQGDSSAVVAKVGDVMLRESQIVDIYGSSAIKTEDSVALKNAFVNNWILEQVKLQNAEREIKDDIHSETIVEKMVEQYRNNIVNYTYEQKYLANNLDTTVTDVQIEAYYRANQGSFKLVGPLVKAIVVRIPTELRQSIRLEELFSKGNEQKMAEFINICQKNDYRVDDFRSQWEDFSVVLQNIPFKRTNFDDFLKSRTYYEVADDQYKYMMRIIAYLPTGTSSPIERESATIKKILRNQRRGELLKQLNDSLLYSANSLGLIEIVDNK